MEEVKENAIPTKNISQKNKSHLALDMKTIEISSNDNSPTNKNQNNKVNNNVSIVKNKANKKILEIGSEDEKTVRIMKSNSICQQENSVLFFNKIFHTYSCLLFYILTLSISLIILIGDFYFLFNDDETKFNWLKYIKLGLVVISLVEVLLRIYFNVRLYK